MRFRRTAQVGLVGLALQLIPAAGLVAVTTAACSAPTSSRNVSTKEVGVDILLGANTPTPLPTSAPATPTAPPPPENPVPIGFPGVVQPPLPPVDVSQPDQPGATASPTPLVPTTPPATCPAPDYLAAPKREAATRPTLPPQPAAYGYKNVGHYTIKGQRTVTGRYPDQTTREVSNPKVEAGSTLPNGTEYTSYTFDVQARLGYTVTTSSYRVISTNTPPVCTPDLNSPTNCKEPRSPSGLYLTKVTTTQKDGSADTFSPAYPGVKLVEFDLLVGNQWDGSGADGTTRMALHGQVVGKQRVYACGKTLDSWQIKITDGRIVSPTADLTFSGSYNIAPQYGALFLSDSLTTKGTQAGATVDTTDTATILSEPEPAKAPS
jgi:hypothetical protein